MSGDITISTELALALVEKKLTRIITPTRQIIIMAVEFPLTASPELTDDDTLQSHAIKLGASHLNG